MKTLVYSSHGFDKPYLERSAGEKHEMHFTEKFLNKDTAELAKGFECVSLFSSDNASSEVLELLSDCGIKYIALRSAGYDHVDLKKSTELGIKVANVPAYSPYAIAEHAVTMLMTLNRKILLGQSLISQGDFRLDKLIGFDLHGKTVGVVGTGKIGSAFAQIMYGFGCRLVAYDIEKNSELVEKTKIEYVTLDELCRLSDVISVSCPLNVETKYLFCKNSFAKMKRGVVFINTARGAIVNTLDLIEALDSGVISAAGLDVYEYEKPIFFRDHTKAQIEDELFLKLKNYPNVLITGHQAFLTEEALEGIASCTIANLDAWVRAGFSENDLSI